MWEKLSEGGTALMEPREYPFSEKYGWLQDKYGLSWQKVPNLTDEMLKDNDPKKIARVTEAFLQMKKLNIAKLKKAYEAG